MDDLAAVQRRRLFPTRMTQAAQVAIQRNVLAPVLNLARGASIGLPFPLRLLRDYPVLRRIPARMVGMGVRPEHVRTPNAFAGSGSGGCHPTAARRFCGGRRPALRVLGSFSRNTSATRMHRRRKFGTEITHCC